MDVINMVLFVFHPMPNTSDKHELIKTILYPIKRIHISAYGWIVGWLLFLRITLCAFFKQIPKKGGKY